MMETWQPLAFAGLGAFHGLNPAMGWLFCVALGLHRHSRAVVWTSLVPIAAGHAVSIAAVAGLLIVAGTVAPERPIRVGAALILLGWAAYHWRYGHRQRVRFGMQTGLWGLAIWSCLMATAHGAGLMLWPVLMPLCGPGTPASDGLFAGLAGVGIHTGAMVLTTAAVAAVVYEWLGLGLLRRAWINVDLLWTAALAATGLVLLVV